MNFMDRYFSFLIKRRVVFFSLAAGILLIMMIFFSYILGDKPNPALYNIFFLLSSVIINLMAASLWYSLLVADKKLQKSETLMKAFPFLKDKSNQIFIIFSSVPSATGHETTGIGEARGLGILLESLKAINFPPENISINYSNKYSDKEMNSILNKQNVILLGGPNFNKFTKAVIEENHEKFNCLFKEAPQEPKGSESSVIAKYQKPYLGTIVNNTIRQEIVSHPEPQGVTDDISVTKDCGLIARLKNNNGKFITILAGGMTPGVWVATKLMTEYDMIEKWHSCLKLHAYDCEFELVFENDVKNVLSIEPEDIRIIKTVALTQ